MAQTESKFSFTMGRLWRFVKTLLLKKKSAFGLTIIMGFIVVALGAPLITPYSGLGEDRRQRFFPLSGASVAPVWLRHLPTWLGGNPDLSENMVIIKQCGLPRLVEDDGEWNLTKTGEGISYEVREDEGFWSAPPGFKDFAENGSFMIQFTREPGDHYNQSRVLFYHEFDYTYTGPPSRFIGNIELLVNGTTTNGKLDVPVNVTVYLGHADGRWWKVWPCPIIAGISRPIGFALDAEGQPWGIDKPESGLPGSPPQGDYGWIVSRSSAVSSASHIDSQATQLVNNMTAFGEYPEQDIFSAPGEYVYGIEIIFLAQESPDEHVETSVFIDDFGLLLHGTCFGYLGTDHHGRSLFAQLVYGARISLYLGILVAVFSVVVGLAVGLAAGYLGKFMDELLMRITDVLLVLPGLPLLIVLVAVLGASIENLILLLGVLGWMGFARMVRSSVLSIKERPFVEAAKAVGAGPLHIIVYHILPSVMSLTYISLATSVPGAITAEASLAWLGFFDPLKMSWGRMLNAVFEANAIRNWWWVLPPGLLISLLSVAFILVGYALDEVLNPKLRLRK
jgi:ABC-type dipeptide/oligopeptide/nickel transport system permease subunit